MEFVATGPAMASEWCFLPGCAPALTAPGGVVLCIANSLTPHPDAAKHASRAWELLTQWTTRGGTDDPDRPAPVGAVRDGVRAGATPGPVQRD